jgi:hypothetical protein
MMEPVIADFPDGAGATEEAVGAGVGVVIGAVVTAAGVALASWPSLAVGAGLPEVAAARPASVVFETPCPVAEFAVTPVIESAVFEVFEGASAVDVPFRLGREADTKKWLLAVLRPSGEDDAPRLACSGAAAFEVECGAGAALSAESIATGEPIPPADFVADGKPCAASSFEGAGSFVGASAFAATSVSAFGA